MKDMVEELNSIHQRIGELRTRINDLDRDIGTGNSIGRETRDSIYKARMVDLIEEYDMLITRLKDVIKDA